MFRIWQWAVNIVQVLGFCWFYLTRDKNSGSISTRCHQALEGTAVNDCLVHICHRSRSHKAWFWPPVWIQWNTVSWLAVGQKNSKGWFMITFESSIRSFHLLNASSELTCYLCPSHCPVFMFSCFIVSFIHLFEPKTIMHTIVQYEWTRWHTASLVVCIYLYIMCV